MAFRIALNSTSSPNGFVKNSTAPAFMGLDRHRHVPLTRDEDDRHVNPIDRDTLRQIETIEVRRLPSSIRGSSEQGFVGGARNSCAVQHASGCHPAQRISNSSDSRTETSSLSGQLPIPHPVFPMRQIPFSIC